MDFHVEKKTYEFHDLRTYLWIRMFHSLNGLTNTSHPFQILPFLHSEKSTFAHSAAYGFQWQVVIQICQWTMIWQCLYNATNKNTVFILQVSAETWLSHIVVYKFQLTTHNMQDHIIVEIQSDAIITFYDKINIFYSTHKSLHMGMRYG